MAELPLPEAPSHHLQKMQNSTEKIVSILISSLVPFLHFFI
jgi:hypothetical protein